MYVLIQPFFKATISPGCPGQYSLTVWNHGLKHHSFIHSFSKSQPTIHPFCKVFQQMAKVYSSFSLLLLKDGVSLKVAFCLVSYNKEGMSSAASEQDNVKTSLKLYVNTYCHGNYVMLLNYIYIQHYMSVKIGLSRMCVKKWILGKLLTI